MGRVLINAIHAFLKEAPETSLTPSYIRGHGETAAVYRPGSGLHQTPDLPASLSWIPQPPEK